MLAARARQLNADGALAGVLRELDRYGHYERRVALHMAMAGCDFAFVERALAGPDLELRKAALRAVRLLPVRDEAVPPALADAPATLRRAVYRTLLHGRRTELASSLLPAVHRQWGDREAALLLPACDRETVLERLPGLAHAVGGWGQFARRHPAATLAALEQDLLDGIFPGAVWRRYASALALIATRDPGAVLALFQRNGQFAVFARNLPRVAQASLLRSNGRAALRILHQDGNPAWDAPVLFPDLRPWSDDDIADAFADFGADWIRSLLAALPPGRRAAVWAVMEERSAGSLEGLRALPLLDVLPPETAARQARQMLDWHASVWHSSRTRLADPDLPLRLTAYLPYAEVGGALREAPADADPRRRGLARTLLLGCAARTGDPATTAAVLTELADRTVNEQDPLRESLLAAALAIRPALLTGAWLPALESLAEAVAAARDCSAATRAALTRLACRVARHAEPGTALADWGVGVLAELAGRFGAAGLRDPGAANLANQRPVRRRRGRGRQPAPRARSAWLALSLPPGQEQALAAALAPALTAARERGDWRLAIALARALGRRAAHFPELQADLRRAVAGTDGRAAETAVGLWPARTPDREARAVAVLAENPVRLRLPEIWRMVAGRRTDLLLDALRDCPPDAEWIPLVTAAEAGRWTPDQRDQVRALLAARVSDADIPLPDRARAVTAASRIPGRQTTALITRWADDGDATIAEAALAALPLAAPPGDALRALAARGGAQSRAATAALSMCASRTRPSELEPALEHALSGAAVKVTVRKQAARLLGWHRTAHAADLLLRSWGNPGLHPDVRVAVAGALRTMPEDPRALGALRDAAAAHASEFMLRTLFQATPAQVRSADRPAYAALVRTLLPAASGPGVEFRARRAFGAWARWYKGGIGDLLAAARDPGDPAGDAALPVLTSLLREGIAAVEILSVLEHLAALPADLSRPESPAMHRLMSLADTTQAIIETRRDDWPEALGRRAVACLRGNPRTLGHAARVAVALLSRRLRRPGFTAELVVTELDGLCELIGDRPALAASTADEVAARLPGRYGGPPRLDSATLLAVCQHLADEPAPAPGLLACALLKRARVKGDWTRPWTAVLLALRQSPHEEVSRQAWEILVEGP